MTTAFLNGPVLTDGDLRDGLAVVVADGFIREIVPAEHLDPGIRERFDLEGDCLLPGFIDVQVNGGGGVLFNEEPTLEGITAIAKAHRRKGTTGLLPTLISDDLDVIRQGLAATRAAIEQGVPGVLGIHIEGPFLNRDRRGAHDAGRIRKLDWPTLDALEPLDNGATLLTLAPETLEPGMIRTLVSKGFIVSAGHSNATFEQVEAAAAEGLTGFTHLYNAMSQLTAREPGMVGAALRMSHAWCGLIADGHHVSPASADIAWRCKGTERLMLVTDAMPNAGTSLTEFMLQGRRIVVADGVCKTEDGTLAGASLDLAAAVRNMMAMTGCSLAEAVAMASSTPAAFLGLAQERGTIAPGLRADFVVADTGLNTLRTIAGGG